MVPNGFRKIKSTFILAIIIQLLGSCISHMKTRVQIIDNNAIINSIEYKQKDALYLKTQLERLIVTSTFETFKKNILSILDNRLVRLKVDTNVSIKDDVIDDAKKTIAKNTDNIIKEAISKYKPALDNITIYIKSEILKETSTGTNDSCYRLAETLKIDGDNIIKSIAVRLDGTLKFLEENDGLTPEEKNILQNQLTNTAIKFMNQFGPSILDDGLASLIVRAPDKYWRKYKKDVNITKTNNLKEADYKKFAHANINEVKANTFFGNADIAFKMNGIGDFNLKGVRLDANESFKASFQVLNQGIKYLAYSSGIPVPQPGNAGTTTTYGKIPELVEKDSLEDKLSKIKNNYDIQTYALLQVIFFNKEVIDNERATAAQKKDALDRVKKAFSLYQSQVNGSTTN